MPNRSKISSGRVSLAVVLDFCFVLLFVVIGRRSHGENLSVAGVLDTFWPFLTGLVLGWLVALAWRDPFGLRWPGIPVWLVTVAGGMALRAASMQGVELSFVIVATLVLGVFLLGWRAIAVLVVRTRRRTV